MIALLMFWTLCVIGLGGFTRLMDAGLGCPDWPGCYGRWIVSDEIDLSKKAYLEAWIEMIHRYAAGFLGTCTIAVGLYIMIKRKQYLLGSSLILCVIFQALLGMWTVTLSLNPLIVSSHFLGGVLLLTLLTATRETLCTRIAPGVFLYCIPILAALYALQLILGALVSTNYAGLSCPDLLTCPAARSWSYLAVTLEKIVSLWSASTPLSWLGPHDKAMLHLIHRVNAIFLGAAILYSRLYVWAHTQTTTHQKSLIDSLMMLFFIQLGLGIMLILFQLPLAVATLHNIVAALMAVPLTQLILSQIQKHECS